MDETLPDVKAVVGAMMLGAGRALTLKDIRAALSAVAEVTGGPTEAYAALREADLAAIVESIKVALIQTGIGVQLADVAGGFRFQSDPACGLWVRQLLDKGKPNRLSQPSLETLAVIAYRQPVTRAQIEAIRGVNVDHVVRALLEMQLVRIVGRSDLPGRPFLYGTTHAFLEHFGLSDLSELERLHPALKPVTGPAGSAPRPPAAAAERVLDETASPAHNGAQTEQGDSDGSNIR